jgi:hypothetical protein
MGFTTTEHGDHWVCVSIDSTEFAIPKGSKMVRGNLRVMTHLMWRLILSLA